MFKEPSNLTTAKFKMMINSSPHNLKYQCKIDDNFQPEQYSYLPEILRFYNIANSGLNEDVFRKMLTCKHQFRQNYFDKEFTKLFRFKNLNRKNENFQYISTYKSNKENTNYLKIDVILSWYSYFSKDNISYVDIEGSLFREYLLQMSYQLLKQYYSFVNHFPHSLLIDIIESLKRKCDTMSENVVVFFKSFKERCKNCGLIYTNEETDKYHTCSKSLHYCQCTQNFHSHEDYIKHWLQPTMPCSIQSWNIWRLYVGKNNENQDNWMCNGCMRNYTNFLSFWSHICYCGFFRLYLLINCAFCSENDKEDGYTNYESCQKYCQTPHADFVGIRVIKEWCNLHIYKFKCYLTSDENFNETKANDINFILSKNQSSYV